MDVKYFKFLYQIYNIMIDEIDIKNIELKPYNRYNKTIDGLFWKNITFNEKQGQAPSF